jgi:hypothetical protein
MRTSQGSGEPVIRRVAFYAGLVISAATLVSIAWNFHLFIDTQNQQATTAKEQATAVAKQTEYTAWQVIESAASQKGSGGRIDALQDLNGKGQLTVGQIQSAQNWRFATLSPDMRAKLHLTSLPEGKPPVTHKSLWSIKQSSPPQCLPTRQSGSGEG